MTRGGVWAGLAAAVATLVWITALSGAPASAASASPSSRGAPERTTSALAAPGVPVPDQDPFYRPATDLAAARPGDVLNSRPISDVAPRELAGFQAHQLLYRTTSATGEPIATVATVFLPKVPAPGPPRLISYNTAEDSLTTRCAPSYTLRTQPLQGESGAIAQLLNRGWAVVVADYEGPDSHFAVGRIEGQAALDGVRAAERFPASGLDGPRTRVGMMGYSGGSIPTGWANALANEYAPEVNLVGIATGGVAADIREALAFQDGGLAAGGIIAVAAGADRAYPELDLDSLLTPRGRALADRDRRDADGCGGGLGNAPGARISQLTRYPDAASMAAVPRVKRTLDKLDLVRAPAFAAPASIYHTVFDEVLPVRSVDELVAANCRRGVDVTYRRAPIGEHGTGSIDYLFPAINYLGDRLAGKPAPSTCPGRAGS